MQGFADAERIPLHGALDQGDVALDATTIVEVKGGRAAEQASDTLISEWLGQARVEADNRQATTFFLVTKRRGYGTARAEHWNAWIEVKIGSQVVTLRLTLKEMLLLLRDPLGRQWVTRSLVR